MAELSEDSVRTYRLSPEGYSAANRRLLWQRTAAFLSVAIAMLVIYYKAFGDSWHNSSNASIAGFALFLSIGAIALGVKKGHKRSREAWNSYELVIGSDFLIRRIKDFPELEIRRDEITAIKESADGLRIETATKGRVIGIGAALDGYQDAQERLSRWMAVTELKSWNTSQKLPVVSSVLFAFLFVSFYLATTSWAIVAVGLPLLVGLAWCLWLIQRSPQLSTRLKRQSLLAILPLLAIAAKLILAITNWK